MMMGNGRRSEQLYRGNPGYGKRFHQNFQTTSTSTDIEENCDEEDQVHQPKFAQIDELIETSPCYFADKWEIAESREEKMNGEIQLKIIEDSRAAISTISM